MEDLLGDPTISAAANIGTGELSTQTRTLLVNAQNQHPLAAQPGQVVHVIRRVYNRQSYTIVGGPAHLDPAVLTPETTVIETWAIADDQGHIARAVTYTRDEHGRLLRQSVIDAAGHLISYDAQTNETTTGQFPARGAIADVGNWSMVMRDVSGLAEKQPEAIHDGNLDGRAVQVLECHSAPTREWLDKVAKGEAKLPINSGVSVRTFGRRLAFDRTSSMLLADTQFVITDRGEEEILHMQEWQRIEVVGTNQVPAEVLSPKMPSTMDRFVPVPRRKYSVQEAAMALPFRFYTVANSSSDLPDPTVSYTTGPQYTRASVPLPFRGLLFSAQRGEAAVSVYNIPSHMLEILQGPSTSFAASLQEAPAFWAEARPVTLTVNGQSTSGWYLIGAPVRTADDPQTGTFQQLPGSTWLLLPDVDGTEILMTVQGSSEAELLALAARLQSVR